MAAPKKQDDSFNDEEAERNEVKTEDNTNGMTFQVTNYQTA